MACSYRLNGYLNASFSISAKMAENPMDMTRYMSVITI
jgi:hypothetical protein